MIKATISEVRAAFAAFTRIFEETKLDQKAAWSVSRMLRKLKSEVKDFEHTQLKLYKDAGGIVVQGGITMAPFPEREKDEQREDFEARLSAYREVANNLSNELTDLNEREVEIDLKPIPLAIFPKERKNDKGEKEPVEFRATDFANAGPFLVEEAEAK